LLALWPPLICSREGKKGRGNELSRIWEGYGRRKGMRQWESLGDKSKGKATTSDHHHHLFAHGNTTLTTIGKIKMTSKNERDSKAH